MDGGQTHHSRHGERLVPRDGAHGDGVAKVGGGEAELLAIINYHREGDEAVV